MFSLALPLHTTNFFESHPVLYMGCKGCNRHHVMMCIKQSTLLNYLASTEHLMFTICCVKFCMINWLPYSHSYCYEVSVSMQTY